MKKIEKTLIATTIIGMVGIVFAISALRGIPESFDWDIEDE